ncbi:hypothetical protein [Streptomyces sp. NPDC059788]|uniref:hypothetical protein n=1 Tax=Streptomyces sp. NPDC059788 TaxID=3346948 RepID=UPI0036678000
MSARDAAIRAVEQHPSTTFMAPCESLADAVLAAASPLIRDKVRRDLLGDDADPSALVLDAESYRRLSEAITATMTDPNRWDGDDDEPEILTRYVPWLAEGRAAVRAETLGEAADAIVVENDRMLWATQPGTHWAADLLRRMAAEAGESRA